MRWPGGLGILVRQGIPARQILPPKGAPRNKTDTLAPTLWRRCHVLVGLGWGADSLHAQVVYGVPSRPSTGSSGTTPRGTWRATGGPLSWWGGGGLNFDLDYPLRAPPSILASLMTRWLVDADLELASARGRDPLCLYQGPEGTRPSRIDGLLVDTRLATLLHAAERLPRGAIPRHAPVRFDLHLKGSSQRVVKFVRPKPVALAPREVHERLLLTQCLLDPLEAGWQAALSTEDADRAWAFWTTAAEETLLALACPDITPDSLPAGATLPLVPPHLPCGRGTDQLSERCASAPSSAGTPGGAGGRSLALWRASRRPRAPSGTSSAGWSGRRKARARCRARCSRRGRRFAVALGGSARWAQSMLAWS